MIEQNGEETEDTNLEINDKANLLLENIGINRLKNSSLLLEKVKNSDGNRTNITE